jgi:hypothetical protein
MMHTYLQDPERARAYAHLIEHPYGSLRTWSTAIGWTTGKMQRFLASLSRYRLGEIAASKHGTSFTPSDPKVHRLVSVRTDVHRCASAPDLGTGSGLTASRCGVPPERDGNGATALGPTDAGAELLITALNEEMRAKFGANFAPISTDHRGSIRAALRIAVAGIPLDQAIGVVRRRARAYTPDRTGGDLPRSLGHPYLARGTIDEWRREQRDRQQLPLLPQLDMAVERSAPVGIRMLPNAEIDRTPDPAAIDAGVQEFREIANSSLRPQRMK